MEVLGVLILLVSLAIQFVVISLAFKFVAAHEKMANAMQKQSDALNSFLRNQAKKGKNN